MYVTLELIVRETPAAAAALVRQALHDGGAVITRADRLSNKALVYHFELNAAELPGLYAALRSVGQLDAPNSDGVGDPRVSEEALGTLHVLLVHSEPDERIELPRVPG